MRSGLWEPENTAAALSGTAEFASAAWSAEYGDTGGLSPEECIVLAEITHNHAAVRAAVDELPRDPRDPRDPGPWFTADRAREYIGDEFADTLHRIAHESRTPPV
jgi:hypothetical protein